MNLFTRRQPNSGASRSPRTVAKSAKHFRGGRDRPGHSHDAVLRPAARVSGHEAALQSCTRNFSNRHVRTRTHAGVGGAEPRGSLLSRSQRLCAGSHCDQIDLRSHVSIQGRSRPVLLSRPGWAPEETCARHCETTSTPVGLRCLSSSAVRAREYLTCGRTAPERISAHDCAYRKLI